MKKVECEIDCRAIGHYKTHVFVEDDATKDEIIEKAEEALDYYVYIGYNEAEHIDCSTCIHYRVCGIKPKDECGCDNWQEYR